MKKSLSIYIHIPFCAKKCAYCDFLSFAGATVPDQNEYVRSLCDEIKLYKSYYDRYIVKTIYIGGGTPSTLTSSQISTIMDTIRSTFHISRKLEATIEVNPGVSKYTDMLSYIESGINRMSIGMQSTDDVCLGYLGRIHSYNDFLETYDMARRAGFNNVNIDIMSGIPGQDEHSYAETLNKVCELGPEHISSYSLQVEEGTPLASNEELLAMLPDEGTDRLMYAMTKKILSVYGYNRYEISNYSKPGYESKHNTVYWTGGEYLGFGIGASSYFKGERFSNITDIRDYNSISDKIHKLESENVNINQIYNMVHMDYRKDTTIMYRESKMEEFMFLGLRMIRGVSRKDFINRFNSDIYEIYGEVINKYVTEGFMGSNENRVWLTDKGIDVSNYILADFILDK